MSRKIVCPFCERRFDLAASDAAELDLERCDLASRFGRVWRLASEYVNCFRASPGSAMTMEKRVRLLEELARLWERGEFEYDGKRYRVSRAAIEQGLL
ncbi:MAG: hypothetical protein JXL84_15045 [Deltaproteobacteria bacterium]|nr:hypothetical protein [Deltaproteobacteria bacterium]